MTGGGAKTCYLVFPHQLFADVEKHLGVPAGADGGADATILLWDDPVFYGDRRGSPHGAQRLRLNPLRIAYARSAVAAFLAEHPRIRHVTTATIEAARGAGAARYAPLLAYDAVIALDPVDALLESRLARAGVAVTYRDTPAFLLTRADVAEYSQRVAGHARLQQAQFYKFLKAALPPPGLGAVAALPSHDAENRAPYPRDAPLPPAPRAALTDVTTPKAARAWLKEFVAERFALFGRYEDAIVPESPFVYHSGLSVFLNNGLLTPRDVLEAAAAATVPPASYEGFVRQLAGWREYARFYYRHVPPAVYKRNVFGLPRARGDRPSALWYRAATGLPTVDAALRDAFRDGYLHHIRRLMVVSNAMTLAGLHPDAVFTWMYEFSLDSWDWVMVFNVYGMGTWSDGGVGMRKPYVSGASYLNRMVRGGLSAAERDEWNRHFAAFLVAHADVLSHTQLAGAVRRAVAAANKTNTYT